MSVSSALAPVPRRRRRLVPVGGRAAYVLRRLALIPVQLLGITVVVFVIIRMLPTDPVSRRVGLLSTREAYEFTQHQLGLDASTWEQLRSFVTNLLHLDLGTSWETTEPVLSEIAVRIPVTLQLITIGFLLALAVGLTVGALSAVLAGSRFDRAVFSYCLFAGAQPEFWWGLMFLFLFSYTLQVFPVPLGVLGPETIPPPAVTHFVLLDALIAGRFDAFSSALSHFALPALTLAFVLTGPIVKMTRQTMMTVLRSDFMIHARARGLSTRQVATYALRNALPPIVTLVGVLFGFMLGGAVLLEQIFSLDGIGQYALQRTLQLDYPSMQGVVVVLAGFSLLVYLVVDILYSVIDPRIEL